MELINKKLSLTCKLRLFSSSNEIKIRSDQSKKNVFQIVFLTDQLQKFYDLINKYFKNDPLVSNLDKILTLENYALF